MSEPTTPESPHAPERMTPSRWPLVALVATTLMGLGGTGYYFLYQKEEMASRRRQEASPLAYFEARQKQDVTTEEAPNEAADLPMPDVPADMEAMAAPEDVPAEEPAMAPEESAVQSEDQLTAQEQRIVALEARIEALTQEMEGLSEAMAHMPAQTEEATAANDRGSLVAQFYRVRQQAMDAHPFDDALAALLAMEGLDGESYAALGKLQGAAEQGIPSVKSLQKEFARCFEEYLARRRANASTDGMWSDMKGSLAGLVRVRKVGAQHDGDDDASLLARAEAALNDGKLPDAVKEIAMLSPEAAPYFTDWRGDARRRLHVLSIFERLESRLLRGT